MQRKFDYTKAEREIKIDWFKVKQLRNQHWKISEIVKELGISYSTFLRKKKEKGIDLK